MGKIIQFPGDKQLPEMDFPFDEDQMTLEQNEDLLPISQMPRKTLKVLLPQIEKMYEELEANEPEDPESEEYYQWAEELESLDDLLDEIQDLLDE